ncbi:androgen-dependent TFPI-regulating protein isoform X3 [Marmota marmota marmota]|uniref:androgen-dependent TFPI-regulating protein isoform X3 n=1 Tax=Marmota marmota marmota TaxID=9994 RepID=UPI0020922A0B|nr:androgen-dependent TFPI-regulating protein isoform X3 [Marmota marmota marmota]
MRTCTCIYHFLVLNWYIFLNYYIPRHGNEQKEYKIFQDGAQWKYLTLLNLFLQAFFFGVACLDDVLKRIKGRRNIRFITAFRDLLFTTLAFPVSTFVFLVFWTIFLYDRELVYPKILDEIFPIWMNHAMHTFILPFSLLEVILRPHHYPSKKTGITLLAAGTVAYTARGPWALVATDNHQQVPHTVDTHGDAAGRWQWASCQHRSCWEKQPHKPSLSLRGVYT